MNDFLQSLRASTARSGRQGMTRKSYDHDFHSMNQRYHYYSGHLNQQPQPAFNTKNTMEQPAISQESPESASASILLHSIENLAKQVEQLADNQTQLIKAQERTAKVIERQTLAIEKIIAHMG